MVRILETVALPPQGTGAVMGRNLHSHKSVKEDGTAKADELQKKPAKEEPINISPHHLGWWYGDSNVF